MGCLVWKTQKEQYPSGKTKLGRLFDFVLPSAIEHEPFYLVMPRAYMMATSAYVYCFRLNKADWKGLPPLQVLLEFEDIAGDKYRAPYEIGLHLVMLESKGFTAMLEPKAVR